jgi:hypothetical protein
MLTNWKPRYEYTVVTNSWVSTNHSSQTSDSTGTKCLNHVQIRQRLSCNQSSYLETSPPFPVPHFCFLSIMLFDCVVDGILWTCAGFKSCCILESWIKANWDLWTKFVVILSLQKSIIHFVNWRKWSVPHTGQVQVKERINYRDVTYSSPVLSSCGPIPAVDNHNSFSPPFPFLSYL